MDHDTAVKTQAAERYVLGELTGTDRDGFEEHFFECVVCGDQVRETAAFMDSAAAVLQQQQTAPRTIPEHKESLFSIWWGRMLHAGPAFAAACLVLGALNIVQYTQLRKSGQEIASLTTAQPVASVTLMSTRAVASGPVVALTQHNRFFEVVVDLPPGQESASYECTVMTAAGATVLTQKLTAPNDGGPLRILLPAASFEPGSYVLKLRGGENTQAQEFQFGVKR